MEEFTGTMNSDGETASENRFTDLCKTLKVSEEVISEAVSVLNEIKSILLTSSFGGREPEEMEIYCYAFVLYCAIKLKDDLSKEDDKQGRITLSDILRATNLKPGDFFKEAKQFTIKAKQILGDRYGFDWEDRLELKLQKIVRMLNDARKFYDKTFGDFFSFGSIDQSSSTPEISKEIHRFGWLLFLNLRIDTPHLFNDLVSCVHGLVTVLAILILHVPVKFRNFSPQDTSRLLVKRSERGVDLLASLSNTYHTFKDCLNGMMQKAYKIISETLNQKPILASDCETDLMNHINTEGLMYFNNMLEEGLVGHSIQVLEKHYMDVVANKGEVDNVICLI